MVLMEANAAVAQLLNHQKAIPKKWQETYEKRLTMLRTLKGNEGKAAVRRRQSLKLRLEQMRLGKKWNLGTSLRNYIDPRVAVEFCRKVEYDWQAYYPKTLVSKFAWADKNKTGELRHPLLHSLHELRLLPNVIKNPHAQFAEDTRIEFQDKEAE